MKRNERNLGKLVHAKRCRNWFPRKRIESPNEQANVVESEYKRTKWNWNWMANEQVQYRLETDDKWRRHRALAQLLFHRSRGKCNNHRSIGSFDFSKVRRTQGQSTVRLIRTARKDKKDKSADYALQVKLQESGPSRSHRTTGEEAVFVKDETKADAIRFDFVRKRQCYVIIRVGFSSQKYRIYDWSRCFVNSIFFFKSSSKT